MITRAAGVAAALFLVLGCGAGWATPIASLTFTAPNGTAYYSGAIPVWVTLSLDPVYGPLTTDGSSNVTSGYTTQDVLDAGVDPTQVDFAQVNAAYGCFNDFTPNICSGPPYTFLFNVTPPTLVAPANLNLGPGSSADFLLGTFVPVGGMAPQGTYSFSYAAVFIQLFHQDPTLGYVHLGDIPIADTTSSGADAFTRNVTVPEPASGFLMLAGLGLAAGILRRKARI